MKYEIIRLIDKPEIKKQAAVWFHEKWNIPLSAYMKSEEDKRSLGIAGSLLKYVCADMKSKGIDTLYLVTDHTSFYERYGWKFLCMARENGSTDMTRMYVHKE